jgi:hypothetical protein
VGGILRQDATDAAEDNANYLRVTLSKPPVQYIFF